MKNTFSELNKHERQIMDIIYHKGGASSTEIQYALPDNLSNSGVRTILRSMLKKVFLNY